jgi:hypothetical protein
MRQAAQRKSACIPAGLAPVEERRTESKPRKKGTRHEG